MNKILALTLGSAVLINSTVFAFSDLTESHWGYRNVMDMQNRGIVSGFDDNTFKPDNSLTRDQFITMSVKGLKIENPISTMQFEDSSNRWSEDFIKIAGAAMSDSGDTKFRPDDLALREDVAMAIVKLNNLEDEAYDLGTLNNFSDSQSISESRKKYVAIAVENGFMSGNANGTFSPKKALTRAEGATVILNMLNKEISKEPEIKEDTTIEWNGAYISNVNGLTKVKLTKISEAEVNFFIKGRKSSLFAGNANAVISGNTAKYEYEIFDDKGEINFRFEDSDLIIETSGYDGLTVFDGRYKVDDGTVSKIERTAEKNPLEGSYLLGDEINTSEIESLEELGQLLVSSPISINLEISNISSDSAAFTIDGFVNKDMVFMSGNLEKHEDKWKYLDTFSEEYTIEIELKDDIAIVTGLNEKNKRLSGTYSKKAENLADEYKKYEEYLDGVEVIEGGFIYQYGQ